MTFIRPTPWSEDELAASIDRFHQHWAQYGYGMWMIADKVAGGLMGYCGLRHHPDLEPIEVGYIIDRPHWGKGIAGEAAGAVIAYAKDMLKATRLAAVTAPGHTGSRRALEKIGFHRQANVVYNQEISGYFLQDLVNAT